MTGRPLRLIVVHNRYRSGQPSGEDRAVDQEAALLSGAGHQVETFERRSDDIATMSLPRKAAVPLRVPWNRATRAELARRLRADPPDVVHIHNTFPLLSPSVVAACADAGVPSVATLHNYQQVCPSGTLFRDGEVCTDCVGRAPMSGVRHGCYRGSAAATVPLTVSMIGNRRRWRTGVTRFFCISTAQRDVLVAGGMPAGRLIVRHNSVPDGGVRRTGPGEHVLFLGRMTAEKGVLVLRRAWERLAAGGGIGVPLVLAGTGPLQDEVAAWADHRPDVRYLGLLDGQRCRELTAQAAAVVVPSAWMEAFGLVAVEAMAAGVPVVASGHGALPELVREGVTGLLHRPGDSDSLAACLARVVADPAANRAMGQAGRRRYENGFSPEAGLQRLVEGYREAIEAFAEEGGPAAAAPVAGSSPVAKSVTNG